MQVVLKWRRFLGILALQKRNINSKGGDPALEKQNKTVNLLLLIRNVRRISKNAFCLRMVRQLSTTFIILLLKVLQNKFFKMLKQVEHESAPGMKRPFG